MERIGVRCPNCGVESAEDQKFCGNCGWVISTQIQQPFAASFPMARRTGTNRTLLLVIIAVLIALTVVIAAVIMAFSGSTPHMKITSWTPTNAVMFVIFNVEVLNSGEESESATIHCAVTFSNGDSYTGAEAIDLGPGESRVYVILVTISSSHMVDSSREYSCALS